eukprot:GHVU01001438.1.p2 GENE.GHVU01001438.1~~GHVU01001438.1.p2  ORF type:complete len:172 (-),score=15.60 GHVU01001438.1:408-923(-)
MVIPPTPDERLEALAEEIISDAVRPCDVYTVRPWEAIRYLLWLGPAERDEERSRAAVRPWLDRVYVRAVDRQWNRWREIEGRLEQLGNSFLRAAQRPEDLDQPAYRTVVYNWIIRGAGERDPAVTRVLTDVFFDGLRDQFEADGALGPSQDSTATASTDASDGAGENSGGD